MRSGFCPSPPRGQRANDLIGLSPLSLSFPRTWAGGGGLCGFCLFLRMQFSLYSWEGEEGGWLRNHKGPAVSAATQKRTNVKKE